MILIKVLQGLRHFGGGQRNRDKRQVKAKSYKI
ncbi:hypothetical protein EDP2_771 [Enterobacter cloacae S611]|uniref:Uncharacterized protein n=1 Tax=Enterobacter cloacae S611 TaxID=1399146 RepID=A0ABN0Q5Q6_ENTCL|nr:hypothetical protein EDP2_771 [Enterobacter cloacae S611]